MRVEQVFEIYPEANTSMIAIWASRKELASVILDGAMGRVIVTPFSNFSDNSDYIVVEEARVHSEPDNPFRCHTLLQGKEPLWYSFPRRWMRWLTDVESSAVQYIIEKIPESRGIIDKIAASSSKQEKLQSWDQVVEICKEMTSRDFSNLRKSNSWAGVRIMPVKIAQRLGGWNSPVAKPVYEDKESGGAVLLEKFDL